MKPPKYVIESALSGKAIIRTKSGPSEKSRGYWSIYQRPEHMTSPGQKVYELEAPDGSEWTLTKMTKPPFSMFLWKGIPGY